MPQKWAKWSTAGHFAPETISSTAWTWGLHADAHDFSGSMVPAGKVAARVFATHFGHLAIVSAWISGTFILGARFSNFETWVGDASERPLAQSVWASRELLQESLNQDRGVSSAIRVTTGVFQVWRSCGFTTNSELFSGASGCLVLSVALIAAGWYHHHRSVPSTGWFSDLDAIMHHHLSAVIGLGSIAWAGHLIHIAWPTEILLS